MKTLEFGQGCDPITTAPNLRGAFDNLPPTIARTTNNKVKPMPEPV